MASIVAVFYSVTVLLSRVDQMCLILISANMTDNGINRKDMLIYLITFLLLNPSELCKCSVYCMESRNYYVFIEIFLLVGQKWAVCC